MKKKLTYIFGALLCVTFFSCSKQDTLIYDKVVGGTPITFDVFTMDSDLETKVTAVTTDSHVTIHVSATTGSAGSESSAWNNVSFPYYSNGYRGGKYWPSTNPGYHFYASNNDVTFVSSGCTVSAANDTDVICAYLPNPEYGVMNSLVFEHIFARIGDVTTTAESGYTITGISVNIIPRTGGTFNLRTGSGMTDGTGWSSISTADSSTNIAYSTPNTKSNDLYLVPGAYDITVSWTATRGAYTKTLSKTFTGVGLVGGKINNFTVTLGGDAAAVKLGARVLPWLQDRIDLNIVDAS